MKKISFLGASGDVTGSSFLITAKDNTQLLVDFGMFQGTKEIVDLNYKELLFNPSEIKGVVITHAHLDHCGRLPLLLFGGFTGKIYMTAPTLSLVEVVLRDAAKIAQEKIDYPPLFDEDQVEKILKLVEVVSYNENFNVGGFLVILKDAGHILGSSSVELTDKTDGQVMVFSGDLGNTPEDIVRPTEYFDKADVVVMEGTYGDKIHPKDNPSEILQKEINEIEKTGGVLLIPAFSIERTQEILHRLHHLKLDNKIREDTPVFLDSPMGIRSTTVFKEHKDFYNSELQTHIDDPFNFKGLTITESPRDSKDILKAINPKVIIAGSGMLSGGRILHHAKNYLSDPSTTLLFVGFQAEETLGRKIITGAKKVVIEKQPVTIRAKIREVKSFSAHADQEKLLDWLSRIKDVNELFIVHADSPQREDLARKIKEALGIKKVFLPEIGQEFLLSE